MGVKKLITKAGGRAANVLTGLAALSPEQVRQVDAKREEYLALKPDPSDTVAEELTKRLMAANSVEIYHAYLNQIKELYLPVEKTVEFGVPYNTTHNIRYFNITKWVTDCSENSLEKLVNVYQVLSNEDCNIALVFNRQRKGTNVYLGVSSNKNSDNNSDIDNFSDRLQYAVKGNFPGTEIDDNDGFGALKCLDKDIDYSVAIASNIPTEKSEKFISQTIEKLLDGIVPTSKKTEYTIVLLATPVQDVEERKMRLAEFYSGLAPYASWQTIYTYLESDATSASATFGLNAGVSAGLQQGQNSAITNSNGLTNTTGSTTTDSTTDTTGNATGITNTSGTSSSTTDTSGTTNTNSKNTTNTKGTNYSSSSSSSNSKNSTTSNGKNYSSGFSKTHGTNEGWNAGLGFIANGGKSWGSSESISSSETSGWTNSISKGIGSTTSHGITSGTSTSEAISNGTSVAQSVSQALMSGATQSMANTVTNSTAKSIGSSVANAISQAVSTTASVTEGIYRGLSFGGNFGANFARTANVTTTIGKNEGISQTFTNYSIKHTLELLENQMKRMDLSTALGMWDFAAYVLSEDDKIANNVAYSYRALTQGEESFMSFSAVNCWRGNMGEKSESAKKICEYIREFRHPIFGLNPDIIENMPQYNVYPSIVTATTSLTGKELAYSLNFPKKSVAGFPILQCADFGRSVASYDTENSKTDRKLRLGNIYHMHNTEVTEVDLSMDSLSSHVFITGSTGSGKSNTVCEIIREIQQNGGKFLVIEPAKGEYKHLFGNDENVAVYGTNPKLMPLLRLNPFSFPDSIHVLEHLDRLVEIFNVCWPMYAAMPAVLKNAIEKSYEDCGWDLQTSENAYSNDYYPSFADVARNIKSIIDSSEYDTENKGAYKGSLLTRLNSLTNGINGLVFQRNELSAESLFEQNVIVDLSRVGSSETKSLLMGVLVLKLQEYRMYTGKMNAPLQHVTVLEEAHNLLKRTSTEQTPEGANLIGKSVEMISNAIAEMRTYGEGFIIADQAPGLIDMAAIRNTNTKIIMRLPDLDDRKLVGKAAALTDDQIDELAKLPLGVAAVYQNEWIQPVLCKVNRFEDSGRRYQYVQEKTEPQPDDYQDRIYIADILSKCTRIDNEIIHKEIVERLKRLMLSDYITLTIIKLLENPPKEPNMKAIAPVMNELFPTVTRSIKLAYNNEADVTEWTREANEILMKYTVDDQVRRDIIQGAITYYMIYETKNEETLKDWIMRGGLI